MRARTKKVLFSWTILVYIFFYVPILILMIYSFNDSKISTSWQGFTFDWYNKLFSNSAIGSAVLNSLTVALFTTLISLIIGTTAAIALYRYDFPGKKYIDLLFYLPIVIPPIIIGVALLTVYARLKVALGIQTIIPGHVVLTTPFVTMLVMSRLQGFDHSLEDAAKDLGANAWNTFWRVTLPLIFPSILSGALLSFTISVDEFVVSFFTTGPGASTLPVMIYSMVRTGVTPEINALSTIMILVTVFVVLLAEKWRGTLNN
ncbi:ABC transporter permease [Pontibacillus marinus]|uniref:Putrescine/spermidine ABC transporter permease n=1 Tax=Pontibacillus marinus BH030004 = DSM 16465 TaxID=1385511 RepID=A0A0A5GID0_9BACI|nr:ABC transporter permease [Pontibacillus marinus]KGX91779.1 putrescine/spermidine ABC transporter permease [Pontibacillus marinus BH030004 = DSM 16465]